MSREAKKTAENFINNLKHQFKNSPYITDEQHEKDLYSPDQLLMSVVIPARQEFPSVIHTIYSLLHCWEADGYSDKEIEIIIVANCDDRRADAKYDWTKPGDRGTVEHLMPRGAYYAGKIKVIYDPIAGNHSARNKGARIARGKYVFFSDAHMAYKPGFFKHMISTIDRTGGLFHGAIAWMGAYPPKMNDGNHNGVGFGYTIKLGEEVKGTWNNYRVNDKDYFYLPALGHCSVGVSRKQFLDFGGYPDVHRCYGGGEFYLNMKWWMFGSTCATHPEAIGYHLASGRGYTYTHDDYIHNVLNIAYALGMDDWRERAYLNWLRKGRKDVLDKMMAEGEVEMVEDRKFIEGKRVKTFNELIVERPWKTLNEGLYNYGLDGLLIFQDSWLDLLKEAPQYVQDAYKNSKYQEGLARFIDEKLSQFVYKRK